MEISKPKRVNKLSLCSIKLQSLEHQDFILSTERKACHRTSDC